MIIKHEYLNNNLVKFNSAQNKYEFAYPCESYSVCSPYNITLSAGYYYLEAYGASGGNHYYKEITALGGYGGYAAGVYRVYNMKTIYLYIGGHADLNTSESKIYQKIFNGGSYGVNNYDSPGGGATDFRERFGNWNEINSLKSRIVTAGAGGGGRVQPNIGIYNGGNGGGLNGQSGEGRNCTSQYGTQDGNAATTCPSGIASYAGTFGFGGMPGWTGAGGGWYGGGTVQIGGGGGGSGHTQNVIEYGSFKVKNEFSNNIGYGKASITVLEMFSVTQKVNSCINMNMIHVFVTIYLS